MGTLRKPLFMTAEGYSEQMAAGDLLELGGLTMSGAIAMGTNKITGLGTPSSDYDAATKKYIDDAIVSGGRIKEALFSYRQLDDADGINALGALYFANQPAVGDTVVLKNGTLTRTYTFVLNQGAESAPTDVSIESSAITAMQRLVTRANADVGNTVWDLAYSTSHGDVNVGVVMVYEKTTAAGNSTSRYYGVWTTQADFQVLDFTTAGVPNKEYPLYTVGTAGIADPTNAMFGLRRLQSALADGEIHFTMDSDELWAWNGDTTAWYLLSNGAVPIATSASGGGVLGKVTADSDYGLLISAGVMKVNVLANTGLAFGTGGDLGKLKGVADGTAGVAVGAGGFAVTLAATNPGLEFRSGGDAGKLGAKADGAHGIIVAASGIEVELDPGAVAPSLGYGANGLKDRKSVV